MHELLKLTLLKHQRRKIAGIVLATLFAVVSPVTRSLGADTPAANGPQRISLLAGALSVQRRGEFKQEHAPVSYVVKSAKGDHMIVNIIPVTKGLTMAGTVTSPTGATTGGPGGVIMNATLKESGDYRIEVNQHTMGSNYSSGNFILEVILAPAWLMH